MKSIISVQCNQVSKKKISYNCPICNEIHYHGNEKNTLKNRTTYRLTHCVNSQGEYDNIKIIINNNTFRIK